MHTDTLRMKSTQSFRHFSRRLTPSLSFYKHTSFHILTSICELLVYVFAASVVLLNSYSWSFTSKWWQIDGRSNGFRCTGTREYICMGGVSVFFSVSCLLRCSKVFSCGLRRMTLDIKNRSDSGDDERSHLLLAPDVLESSSEEGDSENVCESSLVTIYGD